VKRHQKAPEAGGSGAWAKGGDKGSSHTKQRIGLWLRRGAMSRAGRVRLGSNRTLKRSVRICMSLVLLFIK
jgi:hypothetical protein